MALYFEFLGSSLLIPLSSSLQNQGLCTIITILYETLNIISISSIISTSSIIIVTWQPDIAIGAVVSIHIGRKNLLTEAGAVYS